VIAHAPPASPNGFPTRKRIAPFALHRPASIGEALAIYHDSDGAAFYAGGVDMMNRLKGGQRVGDLVHLGRVTQLQGIVRRDGFVHVGSGVTHAAAATALRDDLPELAALLDDMANVRVRFVGTLGGNVMAGDPAYETLPAMAALGARLVFADRHGERAISASAYGHEDGLLVRFEIPIVAGARLLFDRAHRPFAGVMLGVTLVNGLVTHLRLTVSCAFNRPVCLEQRFDERLEAARAASWAPAVAATLAGALPEPASDWVASARYRRRLVGVIAARLLATLECT